MFTLFDPHFAAVAMARPAQIPGRLSAILDERRCRATATNKGALLLSLAALVALLPLAAARPSAGAVETKRSESSIAPAETALPSPTGIGSLAAEEATQDLSSIQAASASRPLPRPSGGVIAAEIPIGSKSALDGVAWGGVKDGLQAGLRIGAERRRFAVSEAIPLTFFIRNTTNHDIAFTFTANPFDDQPLVEDAKGASHHVTDSIPTGLPWAISLILKPGESFIGHSLDLVIGENRDRKPTPYPYFDKPAPGLYRISQSYRYEIRTAKEIHELMSRLDKKDNRVYSHPLEMFTKEGKSYKGQGALTGAGNLYKRQSPEEGLWSKKVEFEVVAGNALVEEPKAPAIVWGNANNGLQAGIGFVENRRRYNIGEYLEVSVYVRNAGSRPTTFSWQSAPQFSHSSLILPTMTGPDGKEPLFSGFGPIEKPTRSLTLQPGEMTQVSRSIIALEPVEGGHSNGGMEPSVTVAPGKHRLQQAVSIKPEGQSRSELTLTSGELEFEAVSSVDRASWGPAIGGLQAGLSFVSERRRYAIGERISMDLYWRNAGRQDITVCYAVFHDFDNMPNVLNAQGARMEIYHTAPLLLPFKQTLTLKPGETVRIGSVNCVLTSPRKQGKDAGEYPTVEVTPGKYRISQYTIVQPYEGTPVVSKGGTIAVSQSAPVSGELEFEVTDK